MCLLGLAALGACNEPAPEVMEPAPSPQPLFRDVAAASGLDFVHRNGATGKYYYPELLHGGVAFLDFDDDGFLDVYLVQSGPLPPAPGSEELAANRLYRNRGDGTFEDLTRLAGVGDGGYGCGAAVADYDGDGRVDLYVTNLGANTLYRNRGDGTFADVTETAGVGAAGGYGYSTCAAFFDSDGDGDLDLFVCNYLDWSPAIERPCFGRNGLVGYCSPGEYERPQADTLYRNNGDGTFTDVSRSSGIAALAGTALGVAVADFDGDERVDLFVANDQMPNHLWLNNGDGTFREEALLRGAALNESGQAEAGMGVSVQDPDLDGDWDLFVVHLSGETNTFYRNGGGSFRDVTDELRLGSPSQPYTGFGTALFDYDNDGYLDVFIANGKVRRGDTLSEDYGEPNQLLRGQADGTFLEVSHLAGPAFALTEVSRGAAFGDYDNDGDVDIVLSNNGGPVRLLRNLHDATSQAHHWLSVELVGRGRNRRAVGARVRVQAGGRSQSRQVQPASSYTSSNDPRAHFGLGPWAVVERLTVIWPDGQETERQRVAADQFLRLSEPGGEDGG